MRYIWVVVCHAKGDVLDDEIHNLYQLRSKAVHGL